MDHKCPACRKDLKGKFLKSKPMEGGYKGTKIPVPVCPYCETLLTPTRTKSESSVWTGIVGAALFLLIFDHFINDQYTVYLATIFFTLSVVVLSWYYLVQQKARNKWRIFDGTRRMDD